MYIGALALVNALHWLTQKWWVSQNRPGRLPRPYMLRESSPVPQHKHQCLVISLLETGHFELVDWLVVPIHGLINIKYSTTEQYFQLWHVFCYGVLQHVWDIMKRKSWGLIFFSLNGY